jgi:DNA-binding response OmpR family regulator
LAEKILVIDDDPSVAELIKLILKPHGHQTYHAVDGQEGVKQAYELQPDLIILDIMMPERDGFETCARLREFSDVPILMLTAKSQSSDVTHGFAVGADDYVKKPFSNDELVSRIKSLLRRNKSNGASKNITGYSDGNLEIDIASQKVSLDGKEIDLTPTELKLLTFLVRNPQKILPTRTLLSEVWGDAYSHDKALLSLYIHQLRQKLKEGNAKHKYIQTQWGQGYWFNPLQQTPKSQTIPEIPEQEETEQKSQKRIYENRWLWVALGVFIGIFAYILYQQFAPNIFGSKLTSTPIQRHTSIEANMIADGYRDANATGLRGHICVKNVGNSPTENLSIVNNIQINSSSTVRNISSTVDLNENPVLDPGVSYCYPFEVAFEPGLDQDAQYHATTAITILNHTGLTVGSKYCPGPQPCPFGLEIATDFVLPER